MQVRLFILLLFACLMSCKSSENGNEPETKPETVLAFDSAKWKTRQDDSFPYRARMLDDLVQSKRLKGVDKSEVIELLGEPTRSDKNYLFYEVSRDKIELLTLRTKTLVLRFSADDAVEAVLVHG